MFEITRTIQFIQTVRSEQFLVTECFFNLFLEVSHVLINCAPCPWWSNFLVSWVDKSTFVKYSIDICRYELAMLKSFVDNLEINCFKNRFQNGSVGCWHQKLWMKIQISWFLKPLCHSHMTDIKKVL